MSASRGAVGRIAGQEASRSIGRRQRALMLEYITAYMAEHGWAPSMREIAAHLGTGPSNVQSHLRQLAAEGKIVLGGGPRMIRLTSGEVRLR